MRTMSPRHSVLIGRWKILGKDPCTQMQVNACLVNLKKPVLWCSPGRARETDLAIRKDFAIVTVEALGNFANTVNIRSITWAQDILFITAFTILNKILKIFPYISATVETKRSLYISSYYIFWSGWQMMSTGHSISYR